MLAAAPAWSACSPNGASVPNGATVTCTGTDTIGIGDGSQNNVTVNVQPGATITLGDNANVASRNDSTVPRESADCASLIRPTPHPRYANLRKDEQMAVLLPKKSAGGRSRVACVSVARSHGPLPKDTAQPVPANGEIPCLNWKRR